MEEFDIKHVRIKKNAFNLPIFSLKWSFKEYTKMTRTNLLPKNMS